MPTSFRTTLKTEAIKGAVDNPRLIGDGLTEEEQLLQGIVDERFYETVRKLLADGHSFNSVFLGNMRILCGAIAQYDDWEGVLDTVNTYVKKELPGMVESRKKRAK